MYVAPDGTETCPSASGPAMRSITESAVIVYAMGSLYTSIIPTLILPGVADEIADKHGAKILLLNGSHDRETDGLTASDVVGAIVSALNHHASEQRKTSS
jgi:2-phospho-L-lactate transferase/gluconeogenesis factor (CofD/UPF0052 family)